MSEDLAHDAHLRTALRHAPDHALVPPSSVSQAILGAARQAHRPARATPAPPPPRMRAAHAPMWRTWLRQLTSPRWAGGWAAALVAALGLGLWLDLEVQPVVEHPSAVAPAPGPARANAGALPETPVPRAVEPRDPVAASVDERAPQESASALRKSAPVPTAKAERQAMARNETARTATQQRADSTRSETQGPRNPDAPVTPAPAPVGGTDSTSAPMPPPATAQLPAAPPAPADSGVGAQRAAAAQPELQARASTPSVDELRLSAASRGGGAPQPAASPLLTLLQRVRADSAAGSVRWTWVSPGGAAPVPFDDAGQAWLQRLMQAARGRWSDVAERGETAEATEVRWWRDGWPHATLRIEADGLRWFDANGRIRYAPLDASTLQRVRGY